MRNKPYQTAGTPWPHRLPTLCAAAVLLWCARGYCTGEAGTGLFWITALLAAAALALPRPLPGSSRWIIWLALAVTVVCMAANIGRLMPVKTDYARLYLLDRLVTALFAALGAGAIFFRIGTAGVTRILLGVLPMAMLVLARQTADTAVAARPPSQAGRQGRREDEHPIDRPGGLAGTLPAARVGEARGVGGHARHAGAQCHGVQLQGRDRRRSDVLLVRRRGPEHAGQQVRPAQAHAHAHPQQQCGQHSEQR